MTTLIFVYISMKMNMTIRELDETTQISWGKIVNALHLLTLPRCPVQHKELNTVPSPREDLMRVSRGVWSRGLQ